MSQLILCPTNSHWLDKHNLIEHCLLNLEFINKKNTNHFTVGNRFLNLLTFMGCAPNIQIDEDKNTPNKAFCWVKIAHSIDPLLKVSKNTRPPKCPHCRKSVNNWANFKQNQHFNCLHCKKKIHLETLNWKQQAGFASTMIIVNNIYPQEAQPTPSLLSALKNHTKTDWHYFYYF